jgi:hypothetical protein
MLPSVRSYRRVTHRLRRCRRLRKQLAAPNGESVCCGAAAAAIVAAVTTTAITAATVSRAALAVSCIARCV